LRAHRGEAPDPERPRRQMDGLIEIPDVQPSGGGAHAASIKPRQGGAEHRQQDHGDAGGECKRTHHAVSILVSIRTRRRPNASPEGVKLLLRLAATWQRSTWP